MAAVHVVALALILIAAALIYAPGLKEPFFADDYLFLDQVRFRPLHTALVSTDPLSNFYRPVSRQLYFWLVSHATGESVVAYHAVSLAMFLLVLVLLFALVHRLAGPQAGLIGTGFLALHYAPDVAVRWASGSQELLAVIGALAALLLHLSGRRWWAALAMLFAALSKEIILLTPLIAAVLDRKAGERWRDAISRAWPMAISIAIWVVLWIVMPQRRAQQGTEVELNWTGPIAVLAHLVQVALGAEIRTGELLQIHRVPPPILPLALVLAGLVAAWWWSPRAGAVTGNESVGAQSQASGQSRRLITDGTIWAVLATMPVAAVSILWSAYYYVFAMCGMGLALGAWLAKKPNTWALVAIALLAWTSASARSLQEFAVARSPWTPQSHINQYYIGRATTYVGRYLEDLKRMYPSFPPRSTLFHSGIQRNIAFQVADGPLVRWAYRDTSLRSYFMSSFSREKLERGPVYFFVATGDSLRELEGGKNQLFNLALGLVMNDRAEAARDALMLDIESGEAPLYSHYLLVWVEWVLGEKSEAADRLRRLGGVLAAESAPEEVARAIQAFQSGDTARAFAIAQAAVDRNALDPGLHALIADLRLIADSQDPLGILEAFAARALAPNQPSMWKRWGLVQAHGERYVHALASFDRYIEVGGSEAAADEEVKRWAARLRAELAAGEMGGGRSAD